MLQILHYMKLKLSDVFFLNLKYACSCVHPDCSAWGHFDGSFVKTIILPPPSGHLEYYNKAVTYFERRSGPL